MSVVRKATTQEAGVVDSAEDRKSISWEGKTKNRCMLGRREREQENTKEIIENSKASQKATDLFFKTFDNSGEVDLLMYFYTFAWS